MKIMNYREQITEFDCGPTAFINALIYLFKRNEIPAEVIRQVYKYTLNDPKIGTTFGAMNRLVEWLNSYKSNIFSLNVLVKKRNDVLFEDNRLTEIGKSSCGILRVYFGQGYWHFINVFYKKGDYLYCFDPYPRNGEKFNNKNREWLDRSQKDGCNLKIKACYINEFKSNGILRAGVKAERYFILIQRRKRHK